ncbi:type II toxin-antitoxin system PrlF family antitoxin [Lichenicoccus roseus]|uniref:AbrB family transcriptional regulator n=1 Tax=Lichenicoccus roseus TaxID=2683649 RepID=A0A5R9J8X1_9PROT|nr:type II toxin-antitoxin system PrlF family antitoxin [Lichenicoccus roseus]TLU70668.1 AbrB family transcriptional regulator [Lichenicoccus roseus]
MPVVEEFCTITARGQTTVPRAVRQALGVGYGGRIAFRVEGHSVTIHAVPEDETTDPALAPFLTLLEADMAGRPTGAVLPLTATLAAQLEAVTGELGEVDPDALIEGEVAL